MHATLLVSHPRIPLQIDGTLYAPLNLPGGLLAVCHSGLWFAYRPDFTRPWGYTLCRVWRRIPAPLLVSHSA
jgi:hypothetical protein